MKDTEIERLRKTIRRSFSNSPHKRKYWLALLDMYAEGSQPMELGGAALNQSLGTAGKTSMLCAPPPMSTRSGRPR
jgi:hypothetical protein